MRPLPRSLHHPLRMALLAAALGCAASDTPAPSSPPSPTPPASPPNRIGAAGGSVSEPGGRATLTVPANALSSAVTITITTAAATPAGAIGTAYEIGPSGTVFATPASLRLRYDNSAIPAGTSLAQLRVATVRNGEWVPLPTTAGAGSELVGEVPHLSVFGVIALPDRAGAFCQSLTLAASGGLPGARLEIRGLVDSLASGPVIMDMRIPGRDSLIPVAVLPGVAGAGTGLPPTFVVPLHPARTMDGGPVQLIVGSGSLRCAAVPFTIAPLPRVTGELQRGVRAFDTMLRTLARQLGADPDALITAPLRTVDSAWVHIAAGLQLLHGPDNPNAIDSLLAGTAPLLRGVTPDFATIDALLATAQFGSRMEELTTAMTTGTPASSLFGTIGPAARAVRTPHGRRALGAVLRTPVTPRELHDEMLIQARAEAVSGSTGTFITDAAGLALGTAAAGSVFIPGGQPIAAAAGTAGMVLSYATAIIKLVEFTQPAVLESMTIKADPTLFNEDRPNRVGFWIGSIGARNKGGKVLATDLLALMPGLGSLDETFRALRGRDNALFNEVTQTFIDYAQGTFTATWGKVSQNGVLDIAPRSFKPVVITPSTDGDMFSWALTGSAFAFKDDQTLYEAKAVGASTLSVRTVAPYFKSQARAASQLLEVRAIEVAITDSAGRRNAQYVVKPGDRLPLRAVVSNADNHCVRWTAPDGGAVLSPACDRASEAPSTVFSAPQQPGRYAVRAESSTRSGLRERGEPYRGTSVSVLVAQLRLLPRLTCMVRGRTEKFSVTLNDAPFAWDSITVTTTGGSMAADGTFTATVNGTVTVRVRSKANPELADEVSFQVAEQCGQFSARVTGSRPLTVIRACGEISGRDPSATESPTISTIVFAAPAPYFRFTLLVPSPLATPPVLGAEGVTQVIRGRFTGNVQVGDENQPLFDQIELADADGVFVPVTVRWRRIPGRNGVAAELSGSLTKRYWRFALPGIDPEWSSTTAVRLSITVEVEFSGIVLNSDSQSCG